MRIIVCGLVLLAAGCGGRVMNAVATTNSFDDALSCAHIDAELQANRRRAIDLGGEQAQVGPNNAGLLLVSPFFLDFSTTIKKELVAIAERDTRLGELAKAKNCAAPMASAPAQAEAAKSEPAS